MKRATVFLSLLIIGASVKLPSNFQKCNRKEPAFKNCTLTAAQDGISQLTKSFDEVNLPNMNPFFVSQMKVEGGSGPVSVQQLFKNCKLHGLRNITLAKFEFDLNSKKLDIVGTFPEFRKLCDYQIRGQILVIPINGKGKSDITLKNLKVTGSLKYVEKQKDKKTYIMFLPHTFTLDPKSVVFNFENAFDKKISDGINPILNSNWRVVFGEVKDSYSEILSEIFVNIINRFFSKVSLEEAFDD